MSTHAFTVRGRKRVRCEVDTEQLGNFVRVTLVLPEAGVDIYLRNAYENDDLSQLHSLGIDLKCAGDELLRYVEEHRKNGSVQP